MSNLLKDLFPEIYSQIDIQKNIEEGISYENITYGSNKKIWWKCFDCDNSWQSDVFSITAQKSHCPKCSTKKQTERMITSSYEKSFGKLYPDLLKEWDYELNIKSPHEYYSMSSKKVHWVCFKGHKWEARISNRTKNNTQCPYCEGKIVLKENSIGILYPDVFKEWHPNNEKTPFDFLPHSKIKVMWRCKNNHEWSARVQDRVIKESRCPYCVHSLPTPEYNLKVLRPELMKEFSLNNIENPENILPNSKKILLWNCFKCNKEYTMDVQHRLSGQNCPYCANKRSCKENCLATLNPKLSKQWHPTLNGELNPFNVVGASHKKVWWLCDNGHEWQANIDNRNINDGCPCCQNKLLTLDRSNSLAKLYPEIACEFNSIKNNIKPIDVLFVSTKKFWWTCKDCGFEWKTSPFFRVRQGSGCHLCKGQHSKREIAIGNELSKLLSYTQNEHKIKTKERTYFVDYLINNIVIEYDGSYWHNKKEKEIIDKRKSEHLINAGFEVIRVRESPMDKITKNDLILKKHHTVQKVAKMIFNHLKELSLI